MAKLGFADRWIRWTMMCVEFVSYSVLVNDDCVGPVIPERGIRQGDPFSPYLHVYYLCGGFISFIMKGRSQGIFMV